MKKKVLAVILAAALAAVFTTGCGNSSGSAGTEKAEEAAKETEEVTEEAETAVEGTENALTAEAPVEQPAAMATTGETAAAGKLLTQIQEGYACDVFFSAAQKQMNQLEEDGLVVEGTRADVVNNQVVVIKRKDVQSAVTGLADIGNASSIALADGSVPVGRYTRTALMNLGILPQAEDASVYTTAEVSDALGGVEISEQGNVSQVLTAVVEGSCEVGTTYLSDTYGYEDELDILEKVGYDLTGNVIYPVCQVANDEASPEEAAAAADFVSFITSDDAKAIFDKYLFDTNLEPAEQK